MRKFTLITLSFAIAASAFLASCSKEPEPGPSNTNNNSSGKLPGSVEGTVTVDGTTYTTAGSTTNSSFGFIMSSRNMTPINSYPAFNISFASKPTKDSTYNITSTNSISLHVDDYQPSEDSYYSISGGSIVVDVTGSTIQATVSNVTVTNGMSQTETVSGSLTSY